MAFGFIGKLVELLTGKKPAPQKQKTQDQSGNGRGKHGKRGRHGKNSGERKGSEKVKKGLQTADSRQQRPSSSVAMNIAGTDRGVMLQMPAGADGATTAAMIAEAVVIAVGVILCRSTLPRMRCVRVALSRLRSLQSVRPLMQRGQLNSLRFLR